MNDPMRSAQPVDQELSGEPVEAHGYLVTPVARVRGRLGTIDDERGSGRYGWVAIRPLRATVVDRLGNARQLRFVNAQAQAIAGMAAAALAVAVLSVLLSHGVGARRG